TNAPALATDRTAVRASARRAAEESDGNAPSGPRPTHDEVSGSDWRSEDTLLAERGVWVGTFIGVCAPSGCGGYRCVCGRPNTSSLGRRARRAHRTGPASS